MTLKDSLRRVELDSLIRAGERKLLDLELETLEHRLFLSYVFQGIIILACYGFVMLTMYHVVTWLENFFKKQKPTH